MTSSSYARFFGTSANADACRSNRYSKSTPSSSKPRIIRDGLPRVRRVRKRRGQSSHASALDSGSASAGNGEATSDPLHPRHSGGSPPRNVLSVSEARTWESPQFRAIRILRTQTHWSQSSTEVVIRKCAVTHLLPRHESRAPRDTGIRIEHAVATIYARTRSRR